MPYKDPEAQKKYFAEYRKLHKVRRAEQLRDWIAKNREASDAYQKAYREKYRDKRNREYREKYARMPDSFKTRKSGWRKNHPEWVRKNYEKNRERLIELQRASYQRHRSKRLSAVKAYARNNPHIAAKCNAKRRFRKDATVGGENLIAEFIKVVRCARRISCYYCKKPIRGKSAHIDHIIPLARGGSHTPDNLCASCPACNLSKHAKLISEWKPVGQQVLAL